MKYVDAAYNMFYFTFVFIIVMVLLSVIIGDMIWYQGRHYKNVWDWVYGYITAIVFTGICSYNLVWGGHISYWYATVPLLSGCIVFVICACMFFFYQGR